MRKRPLFFAPLLSLDAPVKSRGGINYLERGVASGEVPGYSAFISKEPKGCCAPTRLAEIR